MELKKLFYPNSVAIIGASPKEGSVGNDLIRNIYECGFEGKIYPVNLREEKFYDLTTYKSITDIPDAVDLAVIAVPAAIVPQVVEEAGIKGVKGLVVISAGFKEAGHKELEEQVMATCETYGISLIGPNCLGIINPEIKLNASFAAAMPNEGDVAFISQSGALCTAVIDYAKYYGLGFSKFVSIGNKAVVDDVEMLKYLFEDDKTKIIAMYLESLARPQELIDFMRAKRKERSSKPVIVIKSGRTTAGASASVSHTGALAGSDKGYDALFRQAGILRANSVEELFDLVRVFTDNEVRSTDGVAVITNAGGPGVLAADELISNGLSLATLSEKTTEELKKVLPPAANVHNPVDILGDAKADRYAAASELIMADENAKSVLVILTPQSMTEIKETAQAIAKIAKESKRPIVVTFMGEETVDAGVQILQNKEVAAVSFPEQAAVALAAMDKYVKLGNQSDELFNFKDINKTEIIKKFEAGQKTFPEAEALEILRDYGFPLLKSQKVTSKEEALVVAHTLGKKVAMKIVSPDILHKSDVGGVMIDVSVEQVSEKYDEMMNNIRTKVPNAKLEGVLLMEMAPKDGFEFILGSLKDPALGPMAMVGIGGIFVEILKDVTFGLSPITKEDAKNMVELIKSKKIFDGVRGKPALDKGALIDCLGRLSQFLSDFPQVKELDINPLLVLPKGQGVKVLDARIVLD